MACYCRWFGAWPLRNDILMTFYLKWSWNVSVFTRVSRRRRSAINSFPRRAVWRAPLNEFGRWSLTGEVHLLFLSFSFCFRGHRFESTERWQAWTASSVSYSAPAPGSFRSQPLINLPFRFSFSEVWTNEWDLYLLVSMLLSVFFF